MLDLADHAWLIGAGLRRGGDGTDFYTALTAECRARCARYRQSNPSWKYDTYTRHRLPGSEDLDRLRLEREHAVAGLFRSALGELLKACADDAGSEYEATLGGNPVSMVIESTEIEGVYLAVSVVQRTDTAFLERVLFALHEVLPELGVSGWDLMAAMPSRSALDGETVLLQYVETNALDRALWPDRP
jgi:hypothetical protein